MFSLMTSSPCESQGMIVFKNNPKYRLGTHEDVEGVRWNIHGFINKYIQAVRERELHGYYSDTSGGSFGLVQQSWLPYDYTWAGNSADVDSEVNTPNETERTT